MKSPGLRALAVDETIDDHDKADYIETALVADHVQRGTECFRV